MPCSHGYTPESDYPPPGMMSFPHEAIGKSCWQTYQGAHALLCSNLTTGLAECPHDANGCVLTTCALTKWNTALSAEVEARAAFDYCWKNSGV